MRASKGDGGNDAGPPPMPASRLDRAILAYLDLKGQGSARTIQAGLSIKASPEQVEELARELVQKIFPASQFAAAVKKELAGDSLEPGTFKFITVYQGEG